MAACKFHWQKVTIFSHFGLLNGHSLLWQSPCVQLSLYEKSEVTSLVPQASYSFPLFAVHTASDGKDGNPPSLETWPIQYCESESFMHMITAKKQSRSKFLLQLGNMWLLCALSYAPTAITTAQRVHVVTTELQHIPVLVPSLWHLLGDGALAAPEFSESVENMKATR